MARTRSRLAAALVAAGVLAAGCRVQTTVSLVATAPNRGTVGVSVVLDPAAVRALGGRTALAADLSDADLKAEGWTVTGPKAGPGADTTIEVAHAFSSAAEAETLLADVAGTGTAAGRPFRLALTHHRDFWHTYTALSGTVDLRCGLSCFGDAGLKALFGTPTGVDPASLGGSPGQVFSFSMHTRLPGHLKSTDGSSSSQGVVTWTPVLGRATQVAAESESVNGGSVALVIVLVAVATAGLITLVVLWLLRRRRHRQMKADRERALEGAVTPSS